MITSMIMTLKLRLKLRLNLNLYLCLYLRVIPLHSVVFCCIWLHSVPKGKPILSALVGDDAHIVPKPCGQIAEKYIRNVPEIKKYVIMPDHIHMIIRLDDNAEEHRKVYDELRLIGACHKVSYHTIRDY